MEAIFFLIDIIAIIWLLYWSIENDRKGPGAPTTGIFAYRETITRRPRGPLRRGQLQQRRKGN